MMKAQYDCPQPFHHHPKPFHQTSWSPFSDLIPFSGWSTFDRWQTYSLIVLSLPKQFSLSPVMIFSIPEGLQHLTTLIPLASDDPWDDSRSQEQIEATRAVVKAINTKVRWVCASHYMGNAMATPQTYCLGMADVLPIKLVMSWGCLILGLTMLQAVYCI